MPGPALSMVARVGSSATISREPRQARKGATVAVASGAGGVLARAASWMACGCAMMAAPEGKSMSYLVLARKWRPRNFAELVGQEHVRQALVNALDSGRVHHAFLFTGTRGVGKTTIARILAKALNCERGVSSTPCGECGACREIDEGRFVDLIEVDAASRTKVDDTRELLENVAVPADARPLQGLPDRRSAHAVDAFLQRAAEDARGAAAAREVPARDDRSAEAAGDRAVALPAVQSEAAAGRADRGAPAADPRRREASTFEPAARRSCSRARRTAACATRCRCSTRCSPSAAGA